MPKTTLANKIRFTFVLETSPLDYTISGITFPPVNSDEELETVHGDIIKYSPANQLSDLDIKRPNMLYWYTGIVDYSTAVPKVTINESIATPLEEVA